MKNLLTRLWKEESGQDLTEYALLLVLIALASIAVMQGFAKAVSNVYSNVASQIEAAK
jgi:pilus assembly protein Flp/PilA